MPNLCARDISEKQKKQKILEKEFLKPKDEPDCAAIDSVNAVSELLVPVVFQQGSEEVPYGLLMDSGAGKGYLVWPSSRPLMWETTPCDGAVRLADGRIQRVKHEVVGNICLPNGVRHLERLRVLPNSSAPEPFILAGLELQRRMRLLIVEGARVLTHDGLCLFDADASQSSVSAAYTVANDLPGNVALPVPSVDARPASAMTVGRATPCPVEEPAVDVSTVTAPGASSSSAIQDPRTGRAAADRPWTCLRVDDSVYLLSDRGVEEIEGPLPDSGIPRDICLRDEVVPAQCSSMLSPSDVALDVDDTVVLPVEPADDTRISEVLQEIANRERLDLPFCAQGQLSLRKLAPGESRDLPDQTHQFVLRLPDVSPANDKPKASYSNVLYRKLPEPQRLRFDELVGEYQQSGWWTELPSDDPRASQATEVFMHKPASEKPRLVCDFRDFNRFFKDVSSTVPDVAHMLLLLRTTPAETVTVGDASKAFYRVALSPPLVLRAGPKLYSCCRVSFGLSMGPEVLRGTLGLLLDHWRRKLARGRGMLPLYLDDFVALCQSGSGADIPLLVSLARRCGFPVPKAKWQPAFPVSVFNRTFDSAVGADGRTVVSTTCPDKREELLSLVAAVRARPSKRLCFELGGRVGYCPLKSHPYHQLASDVLRSIAGKSKKWDGPLDCLEADGSLPVVLEHTLQWIESLVGDPPCRHSFRQPVGPDDPLRLVVTTDASLFGYGWTVMTDEPEPQVLARTAKAWSRTEHCYHANRQEGLALLEAMRWVARFLQFRLDCSYGSPPCQPRVQFLSDSRSAIAWANGRPPSGQTALEFRMLTRLAEALCEEVKALTPLCSAVEVCHIAGVANYEADALSRALYRLVGSKTLGSLLRRDASGDVHRVIEESNHHVIERLAADCASWNELLYRFSYTAMAFDSMVSGRASSSVSTVHRLVGSLQQLMTEKQRSRYVRLDDGLYYYSWCDHTGAQKTRPVLPAQAERTRQLHMRHYHRLNGHRGSRFDVAYVFENAEVFVEGSLNAARHAIRTCLKCAVMKARVAQPTAPAVFERRYDVPPYSRIAVDVTYCGRKTPVFSALCLDTSCVFFYAVKDGSLPSVLMALRVLAARYSVSFIDILADNAPVFGPKLVSTLRGEGHPELAEIRHTPVRGSTANPVERLHEELWRMVKGRGLLKLLTASGELNQNLELAAAVINHRPLAMHVDAASQQRYVITPARLAFGSAHGPCGERIAAFRRQFYQRYFLLFKRRHNPVARRMRLSVGSYVLVATTASKGDLGYKIAQVVAVEKGFLMVRSGATTTKVVTTAIAPLDQYFYGEPGATAAPTSGSSPGDRVVNSRSIAESEVSSASERIEEASTGSV